MSGQVFISYASEDEQEARLVYSLLKNKRMPTYFAPERIMREPWAEDIAHVIPQCAVFLILWSHRAAQTADVQREISMAAKNNLHLIPVRLDETPYEGAADYFLSPLNWYQATRSGTLSKGTRGEIVKHIQEYLRLENVPYPLDTLYRELFVTDSKMADLGRHINAIGVLARFVALIHAAKYLQLNDGNRERNQSVERLVCSTSLFVDLEVAFGLMQHLNGRNEAIHDGFREFFKLPNETLPTIDDLERYAGDATAFDREHLHLLCDAGGQADERGLCYAARTYMRRALSLDCSTHVPFTPRLRQSRKSIGKSAFAGMRTWLT